MPKDIFSYSSYKPYLQDELYMRTRRNPKYSLRAFARDLAISFSRLSEIFTSSSGLSAASAQKIAKRLSLNKSESEYFINMVLSEHSRNFSVKKNARLLIEKNEATKSFHNLSETNILSKWYYAALVELLCLNQKTDVEFLSNVLKVPRVEITAAIKKLTLVGIIAKSSEGRWSRPHRYIKVESPIPSERIQAFHESMINLAAIKIRSQPIASRKYLSSVMAVKKSAVEEARFELEEFNRNFLKKYSTTDEADMVYGFCLQFFHLNESSNL